MNQRNSLSKQNTDCLKGIFAILVVISHSRNNMAALNDTILGSMLTSAGYLAVAIFFFLSGYGLEIQYQRKGKAYIEQFPRKRILSIFLIYVVSVLFYACFKQFLYGGITIRDLVLSVLFGQTILAYGWYLQAIVLLYILYYLSHKILPEDKQIVGLFIGLIVYIACSVIFADTMLYCQSILAFPFGLIYAHAQIKETENLRVYIAKLIWVLLLFSVTLLVGNLKFGSDYIWISAKLLSAVFFCFFITLVIEKIPINFWVARKLGLIYSEIYIAQEIPISLLRSNQIWIHNDLIYLLLVLIITIFAANLFHPVFSLIQRHLN